MLHNEKKTKQNTGLYFMSAPAWQCNEARKPSTKEAGSQGAIFYNSITNLMNLLKLVVHLESDLLLQGGYCLVTAQETQLKHQL